MSHTLHRRRLLALAGGLIAFPAWAAAPSSGKLRFDVFRAGERIGEHEMAFVRAGDQIVVETQAAMKFKIGPLGVDYSHQAKEVWNNGAFQSITTTSRTNSKRERLTADRTATGVTIDTGAGPKPAPANISPLSHWNSEIFEGPLFNPQNGRLLKVVASRNAPLLPAAGPAPSGR